MLRFTQFSRNYRTTFISRQRPQFHEVFPQKKTINRILFELDSRHTIRKLYPIYDAIYKNMQKGLEIEIPRSISPSDLMIMKKVLEKIRHRTRSINPHLLALEGALLDRSAELGNNDAISLLAFDVLRDPEHNSIEDVEHGKKLIKGLYKKNHHLTIKLLGDLSLKARNDSEAAKYYLKFLGLEDRTFLAGEVYGQLGRINFRKPNLSKAEYFLLQAIKLSPLEYSVHCHFYLAQIYMNSNPLKARVLMENCASQGFRESFEILGFLEMNYFGDFSKAQEWFKLGMELFQLKSFIGFFNCSAKLKDWTGAAKCYEAMLKLRNVSITNREIVERFIENHQGELEEVVKHSPNPVSGSNVYDAAARKSPIISRENKWGL